MKKNVLIVFGIVALAVIFQLILSNAAFFERLELMSYDLRSKFATDRNIGIDKDIVIVGIDDYSLKELNKDTEVSPGHYQDWEIGIWRNIINFIEKGEPKAVMFDMVFEKLTDEPWYNRTFANTLLKYDNIILGTYLDDPLKKETNFSKLIEVSQNNFTPTSTPLDVTVYSKRLDDAISYKTHAPINNLYTEHNTMGVVNSVLDDDSIVRKNQPVFKLLQNEQTYYMPSLAFAGFMKYMGEPDKITIKNNKIYYKDRIIPINSDGVVNISRRKIRKNYSYIPISRVILGEKNKIEFNPEVFKDKLVIIGKTATGENLDLSTIIDSSYAGPENVAVALDNFINNSNPQSISKRKFVSEIPKPLQFLITLGACIIVAILGLMPKSATVGFINGFILMIVYLVLSFWLFINPSSRILMPVMVPLYYLAVTSGVVFALRLHKEMNDKSSIMDVFGRFVSPKVLSTVLKNPSDMVLKSTKKQVTILFCDIKDFSTISEKNPPEKLISNLNELFKEIVNIIFENGGTVDKFIGDCVMAYWGDASNSEDSAYKAVKAALEIKKRVNILKIENAKENKIIFDVKIGINTGEAILGLTGTEKIMSYTAMGDAVNTASRLESSCKDCGRDILITKSTYEAAKDKIVVLDVGKISVKGKEEQIEVYEPLGLTEEVKIENAKFEEESKVEKTN